MHVKVHEVPVYLLVDDSRGALQGHGVVLQPDLARVPLPPFPCRQRCDAQKRGSHIISNEILVCIFSD